MQAQTSVVNFHKRTSNEKTLLDRYHSNFDKGTRSIKVTCQSKLPRFTVYYIILHIYILYIYIYIVYIYIYNDIQYNTIS